MTVQLPADDTGPGRLAAVANVRPLGRRIRVPKTAELVAAILVAKPHPEQGYRACLGLMRLGKRSGAARLEAAAARATQLGAPSYRTVQNILASGVDRVPLAERPAPSLPVHPNIRGSVYYTREETLCSLTPPSTN